MLCTVNETFVLVIHDDRCRRYHRVCRSLRKLLVIFAMTVTLFLDAKIVQHCIGMSLIYRLTTVINK